ncbi:MAG: PAS domain S-box protein [Chloroflexi bacterium]|nr:PAS domain S-box protein [Chloroflexota bacterium]MCL5274695.1 PAS domain S-box protein [Chloroflexota bacterium]
MRGLKLSVKLPLLFVAATVLVAGIGSVLAVSMGHDILRTQSMDASVIAVQNYASAVGFYLDDARSVLETTAHLPEITDFTSAQSIDPALHGLPAGVDTPKRDVAARILEHSKVFEYVMLLRADGSIYLLEPYDLQVKASRPDLAFTGWYKQLMSDGATVISDLHISIVTQRPTVVIATPVLGANGQIIGIWAGALKLSELSQIGTAGLTGKTPQRYGYITDGRGLIIAHQANSKYVEQQTDFSTVPPVRAALAGQRGALQFFDPIGRADELGAYMPLAGSHWAVVYEESTQIAFAPIEELARDLALLGAGEAILLILSSVAITRQITGPLKQLAITAQAISAGDLTRRIEVRSKDELGLLADEFNQMAASLGQAIERLRLQGAALESAANAIVITDREGAVRWVNAAFTALTGYTAEEVIGRNPRVLKSGKQDAAFYRNLWETILAGQVWHGEIINRRKDGSQYTEEMTITPVRDERGEITHYIAIKQNITERKQAEEEIQKLNAELEQRVVQRTAQLEAANKELEAFSYTVSHDLRAPLRAIDGFSRVLLEKYAAQLPTEAQRYQQMVRGNARQMGQLIDDLLTFSRLSRQPLKIQTVTPADLVRQVLQDLRQEQEGRRIEMTIGDFPPCQADPALLRQVWINLIANALKYTRKREVARIEVGVMPMTDSRWQMVDNQQTDIQPCAYFVRDNGVGFDMRYADKLFGVFQRLHRMEEYEGTGVGLAIVQRIIHRHGGRVWAEAEVDKGATFYFTV